MRLLYHDAPRLQDLTTLAVGGPARRLYEPMTPRELLALVELARTEEAALLPIGSGSNLVCSDRGFDGWLVRSADYRLEVHYVDDQHVELLVGAGVEWDELVAFTVAERFAGLECLSGIPGRTGAAPIQNIGAYGAELATSLVWVETVDRNLALPLLLPADVCGLGYRTSRFKQDWRDRHIVTALRLRLVRNGDPLLQYAELREVLGLRDTSPTPSLVDVRRAVLAIRARKSMVLRDDDDNRRSAGSFFTNPVVPHERAARVRDLAAGLNLAPPTWETEGGIKLSAAWLIENAGLHRGFEHGAAGLSSRHTLALVNRGDATCDDILALARVVQARVFERWGVHLVPEPDFVGFDSHPLLNETTA